MPPKVTAAGAGAERPPAPTPPARADVARQLRAEGWSTRAIAARLGVSHTTVSDDCADMPSPDRIVGRDGRMYRPPARTDETERKHRRARARSLRSKGVRLAAIADELGVSVDTTARDCSGVSVPDDARAERRRQVHALREEGVSLRAIAAQLGLSLGTVRRDCAGVVPPPRRAHRREQVAETRAARQAARDAQRQHTRDLRLAGWSIRAIAAKLRLSTSTVRRDCVGLPAPERVVDRHGAGHRPAPRTTALDRARRGRSARALAAAGFSVAEIAFELNASTTTVRRDIGAIPAAKPSPPHDVARILTAGRSKGLHFSEVWDRAMALAVPTERFTRRTERDEWLGALRHARGAFERAFYNLPPTRQDRAAAALHEELAA